MHDAASAPSARRRGAGRGRPAARRTSPIEHAPMTTEPPPASPSALRLAACSTRRRRRSASESDGGDAREHERRASGPRGRSAHGDRASVGHAPCDATLVHVRALLIVNPAATTTTPRGATCSSTPSPATSTSSSSRPSDRGHAIELAGPRPRERLDLVIALGGDGTVNEAVNGLLDRRPARRLPALAVVPGGSTNSSPAPSGCRTTRSRPPASPGRAARRSASPDGSGSGKADDRAGSRSAPASAWTPTWSTRSSAGAGRAHARPRRAVRRARPLRQFFAATATAAPGAHPAAARRGAVEGLLLAIVSNTTPVDLLRQPADRPSPRARRSTPGWTCSRCAGWARRDAAARRRQLLPGATAPHGRHVVSAARPGASSRSRSDRPTAFQVDGDYLGERDRVHFRSVPSRFAC